MSPIELNNYGAYSFKTAGQLMANVSILPFGGASFEEVAYVAGVNMISNMYTAERMEMVTKSFLYARGWCLRGGSIPPSEFNEKDSTSRRTPLPLLSSRFVSLVSRQGRFLWLLSLTQPQPRSPRVR